MSTAAVTTAPSLDLWVSSSLRSLINSAPTNPAIRGTIRNELHLVMPRDINTTEGIKRFLTDNYHNSLPGKTGTTIAQAATNMVAEQAAPARPTRPAITREPNGDVLIPGIHLHGEERGQNRYICQSHYRGTARVPAAVAAQGPAAIVEWLQTGANAEAAGLEFTTENYEFVEFQPATLQLRDENISAEALTAALNP